jgi:hypothetical protein
MLTLQKDIAQILDIPVQMSQSTAQQVIQAQIPPVPTVADSIPGIPPNPNQQLLDTNPTIESVVEDAFVIGAEAGKSTLALNATVSSDLESTNAVSASLSKSGTSLPVESDLSRTNPDEFQAEQVKTTLL